MDKLIEGWARELTITQIAAALGWAAALILGFAKVYKAVFGTDFGSDAKKGFPLFMKWVWRDAIHKKDQAKRDEEINLKLDKIMNEVMYNGGKVKLTDAVKRIEERQTYQIGMLETTVQRMDIQDLSSKRMAYRLDAEGGLTFINDAFLKHFGWQDSDVMGFSFENIIHPDDIAEVRLKWSRAIDKCLTFDHSQERIKKSDGSYEVCSVRGYPIIIDGKLQSFAGTVDIINK